MIKTFLCRNITSRLLWMQCLLYTTAFQHPSQFRAPIFSAIATNKCSSKTGMQNRVKLNSYPLKLYLYSVPVNYFFSDLMNVSLGILEFSISVTTKPATWRFRPTYTHGKYATDIWARVKDFLNLVYCGDRGSTVANVLCYKSESRWFDSKLCHWNFSLA
jgi:hypothetical protein